MLNHNSEKILILGDVHGNFKLMSNIINSNNTDIVFQVGDFGIWPNFENQSFGFGHYSIDNIQINCPLYFCDGNHEDHHSLNSITKKEIHKNVFYMKRGEILKIGSYNVLFMGGAESIDKCNRTIGVDWFPQESICYSDMLKLDVNKKIDIVVSHTCPMEFDIKIPIFSNENITSRKMLSRILEIYEPTYWFFGHFHHYMEGRYHNTNWTMLNTIEYPNGTKWFNTKDK